MSAAATVVGCDWRITAAAAADDDDDTVLSDDIVVEFQLSCREIRISHSATRHSQMQATKPPRFCLCLSSPDLTFI